MEENAAVNAVNEAAAGTFQVRTDLALEQRESSMGEGGDVSGVRLKEWHHQKSGLKLTEVKILNEQGAKSMGKPRGTTLLWRQTGCPRRMTITTVRYRKNWRIRYAGLWRR